MTVPTGVLVVVADNFGIYAQVRVRPRVSASVYVCVSLYDPCVFFNFFFFFFIYIYIFFYIATYLGVYLFGPHFDLYQSLNRLPI